MRSLMLRGSFQWSGIRNRLRCRSLFSKTYVDGSDPGEIEPCSMTRVPTRWTSPTFASSPAAGKSGSDLPAGMGMATDFRANSPELTAVMSTYKNLPSCDQTAGQMELEPVQSVFGAPP